MADTWFEAKVKYLKVNEEGKGTKMTESYLLDVLTYTEAESRISREMDSKSNEYTICNLKRSNITQVLTPQKETDDHWYKAKVAVLDAEEISGKEKKTFDFYLIAANSFDEALQYVNKSLSTYVVPCVVESLTDTNFVDVLMYEEVDSIGDNFKPVGDAEGVEGDTQS